MSFRLSLSSEDFPEFCLWLARCCEFEAEEIVRVLSSPERWSREFLLWKMRVHPDELADGDMYYHYSDAGFCFDAMECVNGVLVDADGDAVGDIDLAADAAMVDSLTR